MTGRNKTGLPVAATPRRKKVEATPSSPFYFTVCGVGAGGAGLAWLAERSTTVRAFL